MQILCSWVFAVTFTCLKLFLHLGDNKTGLPLSGCSHVCHYSNKAAREMDIFFKLSSSLLAVSLFLSEFQAPVWSGKSIIVVKWALSKHPCGGATPVHALARDWGWLWAPAAPVLQSGCAYTDSRWSLIIWLLYGYTCVQNSAICIQSRLRVHGYSLTELNHCMMFWPVKLFLINATFICPVLINSSQDSIGITKTVLPACYQLQVWILVNSSSNFGAKSWSKTA